MKANHYANDKSHLLDDSTDDYGTSGSESSFDTKNTKFKQKKREARKRGAKKEKSDQNDVATTSFFSLFRYADILDYFLLFIGTIAATLDGILVPSLSIIIGKLAMAFTIYGRFKQCGLDYHVCFQRNLTTLNHSMWKIKIQPNINSFQTTGLISVYFIIGVAVTGFIVGTIHTFSWALQASRHTKRMQIAYFKSMLRQEVAYHDTKSSGELNARLATDITTIREGIGSNLSLGIQLIVRATSGVAISLIYAWKIGLLMFSIAPLIAAAQAFLIKITSSFVKKEQNAYAKAAAISEEVISGVRTVTAFGSQKKEIRRYSKNLKTAKGVEIKRGVLFGVCVGILNSSTVALFGLAYWYGTGLVIDGEIDISAMVTSFTGIMLAAPAFGKASSFFDAVTDAKVAGYKVLNLIDRKSTINIFSEDGEEPKVENGEILFNDVYFNYPTRPDVKILRGTSFTVKQGQSVAIIGESGAGKSTTIQLLQRLYDYPEGRITVGGVEVKSLNLQKYRETIGVVSQEPVLFATTIAENIRWGGVGITDSDIIDAAKKANAYDFIMKFPEKFNTLVGDGGGQLSGGQKQRIAIARAIARNPRILLLDEATSALDTESEAVVQAALDKASAGRTTVIVAHRLSTIKGADKIIALQEGKVAEEGTHEELMKIEGGVYSTLTNAQAKLEEKEKSLTEEDEVFIERRVRAHSGYHHEDFKRHTTTSDQMGVDDYLPEFSFRRIISLNRPEWLYIAGGCLAACLAGSVMPVTGLLNAKFLGVFALSQPKDQERQASLLAIIIAICALVSFISFIIESILFAKSGVELTIRIRKKAFTALLRQEMAYFDDPQNSTGAITSRLQTDAARVKGATGIRLGLVVMNMATFFVSIGIAIAFSWKLTLVNLSFFPIEVLSQVVLRKWLEKIENQGKKDREKAAQIASEVINNIRTVISLTKEQKAFNIYSLLLNKTNGFDTQKAFVNALIYGFHRCCLLFSYAATYRLGITLVMDGDIVFESVFIVIFTLINGGTAMGQNSILVPNYAEAKLSARRMFALFDRNSAIDPYSDGGASPSHCKGEITFKSVKFAYPTRPEMTVLKGFDVSVKPGQTLALVGQSGSGKSTTVQLIERFYDPLAGQVKLDGVDLTNLNLPWLRQQLGLVSQEPVLFDQTIEENLRYGEGNTKATKWDIIAAAKSANIHDFVEALPEGYATPVGEKGGKLSGGQKQRIAIARALLRDPKILLLDEATSALDTESEKIVQDALDRARKGRTSIVIAHRLSTIKNADKIAVVSNGVIVEMGTHEELIALEGAYYSLTTGKSGKAGERNVTISS